MIKTGKSVVCTVFEKSYHYGVGALANSLYAKDFRGILYAGYRGELPPWAHPLHPHPNGRDTLFEVAEGLHIHFAELQTEEMLTYVKPMTIQRVWDEYGDRIENVFYVDADIVIKAKWSHFEDWAQHGVALCEDMNSPLAMAHPLRSQWKEYYAQFGIDYQPRDNVYVNGGFVGINRKYKGFSDIWEEVQVHMKARTGNHHQIGIADRWNMFHFMDQDALNVAKDLADRISLMGPEAMDFGKFGMVMSHAAGKEKPWQRKFIKNITTSGTRPSFADKFYWNYVTHPIRIFPEKTAKRKRSAIKLASFLGRFFTKT